MAPVLIVDDNEAFVRSLIVSLKNHDIDAVAAHSGPEALKALEADPSICLVLLDVIMPEMNGLTVFQILREKYPKLWVIFISGEVSEEWVSRLTEDKAISFLPKPFSTLEIQKAIQDAIKKILKGCA